MRPATARCILLALAFVLPAALAQPTPASPASFLVYHAAGGPSPDPLASPLAPAPFDAARLPTTRFDRASVASAAPENAPESAPAHFREFARLLAEREVGGAPLGLRIEGDAQVGALTMRVESLVLGDGAPTNVTLQLVVFEHGVDVGGRLHPYVARFASAPQALALPGVASTRLALDPSWSLDDLGVVAIASAEGEVLQSATWLVRQDAPTEQRAKSVLIEQVTASWCEPCTPAEEALALLSIQRGVAPALAARPEGSHLRAPDVLFYVGLAFGLVAALALVRRHPA